MTDLSRSQELAVGGGDPPALWEDLQALAVVPEPHSPTAPRAPIQREASQEQH